MERAEVMVCQHLYWTVIREAVKKEVTNCDNFQRTKGPNNKYGKLPAKQAEERPRKKVCVELIFI